MGWFTLYPLVVVQPGKVGFPRGSDADALARVMSNPVWE